MKIHKLGFKNLRKKKRKKNLNNILKKKVKEKQFDTFIQKTASSIYRIYIFNKTIVFSSN